MKRSLTIFPITLAMLLLLGHTVVPHNHLLQGNAGISKPAHPTLADLLKATFSHDLGTDHLKVFKGDASCESFRGISRDTPAILCSTIDCRPLSAITIEKVSLFPVTWRHNPICFRCSLRAPPNYT